MSRQRGTPTGGAKASLASDGLTRNERWKFRRMAAHPDIVERIIRESTDENPASQRRVLAAIAVEEGRSVGTQEYAPSMADADGVIRFKLDSGVVIDDHAAVVGWVLEQVEKHGDRYEYVPDWVSQELGGDPEPVVVPAGEDFGFHLDDPVSTLQLVAALIVDSVPGLDEVDSYWNVDWDPPDS